MKYRVFLLGLVLFLVGCGISFNQPAVSPDGTIAMFLGKEGTFNLFLEDGGTLALLQDGNITWLEGVTTAGVSGALDWSADGEELVFIETEAEEWGWNLCLTGVQTDSETVTLLHFEEPLFAPAFTPEGDITYLRLDEEEEYIQLVLYDRVEDVHTLLLEDILSYQPAKSGSALVVIQATDEGTLRLAHVSNYEIATGEKEEIASFFLTQEMEETFFLLPPSFLWDVDPSGQYLALALCDQILIDPEVATSEPSVYLIDTEEEASRRIATLGLIPAFSPDGSLLAYIGSEDGEVPVVYIYNLETDEHDMLSESEGVATLFWIDNETLGITIEGKDENYLLMKIPLTTGKMTPLLDTQMNHP